MVCFIVGSYSLIPKIYGLLKKIKSLSQLLRIYGLVKNQVSILMIGDLNNCPSATYSELDQSDS